MPMFDLPLDQLRTYSGSNPRPSDIEEYWDQALSALEGVSARVEIRRVDHPAVFAECFDLTFTGVRAARIYAKYLRPAQPAHEPAPGVAVFHGYSGRSPDWFRLLPYVAQGYSVVALDCRGQGGRSQDSGGGVGTTLNGHIVRGLGSQPRDLLYRQVFLDCVQVTRILMSSPGVDPARVAVTGMSQGGGLALACAALEPRVKAVASVSPFLCDYRRVLDLDLAENAYAEIRQYLRQFDPNHEQVDHLFTRLGYIDVHHLVHRIRGRVLMGTGLMDTVCHPRRSSRPTTRSHRRSVTCCTRTSPTRTCRAWTTASWPSSVRCSDAGECVALDCMITGRGSGDRAFGPGSARWPRGRLGAWSRDARP